MRIKFLVDYRGKLTSEWYYQAGDVIEVGEGIQGAALIRDGRAVEVEEEPTPDAELAMQHDPPSKKVTAIEKPAEELPAKPAAKRRGRPRKTAKK